MMKDAYKCYTIYSLDEIVLAYLSNYGFESFEEKEDHLLGYISSSSYMSDYPHIDRLLSEYSVSYDVQDVENRNWNAEWESSFQPIAVDDFCYVRADFHPPSSDTRYDIVINPRMAFGTGHHETTYMMMRAMKDINMLEKKVFDYGCGTGILSILADKLGASHIDAIDIENDSFTNTVDNCKVNNVDKVKAYQASLDTFSGKDYDIILANINRNVLTTTAHILKERINHGGLLLMSGILKQDLDLIQSTYEDVGFEMMEQWSKGEWICILCREVQRS